jgi:hypothetical protein
MPVQVVAQDPQVSRGAAIGLALAHGLNQTAATLLAIAARREEARQRDEALDARVAQAQDALVERRMRREELTSYRDSMLTLMAQGQADRRDKAEADRALKADIFDARQDEREASREERAIRSAARGARTGGGIRAPKLTLTEKVIEDRGRAARGLNLKHFKGANPADLDALYQKTVGGRGGGGAPGLSPLQRAEQRLGGAALPAAAPPPGTGMTPSGLSYRILSPGAAPAPSAPSMPTSVQGPTSQVIPTTQQGIVPAYPLSGITRGTR